MNLINKEHIAFVQIGQQTRQGNLPDTGRLRRHFCFLPAPDFQDAYPRCGTSHLQPAAQPDDAMDEWLEEYTIHLASDEQTQEDPVAMALEAVRAQLAGLQLQQENICEYLEKGVYTIDMFTKRNSALTQEIKQLQISEPTARHRYRQHIEGWRLLRHI